VTTPVLRANNEMVTIAFLKTIVGDRVATTLPKDVTGWVEQGFVTVDTVGGTPNLYVPLREPVMGVECWAVNAELAETPVEQGVRPGCRPSKTPAGTTRPCRAPWSSRTGYPVVQVKGAYLAGDTRRIPDDPSSYARYSIPGLVVTWEVA
jgi:hypothetical protein